MLLDEGLLDVFPMKSISYSHAGLLQPPSNSSTIAKLSFLKAIEVETMKYWQSKLDLPSCYIAITNHRQGTISLG